MLQEIKKQQTMKELLSKSQNQRNLKINVQMDTESISEFISDKMIEKVKKTLANNA
jgi:hypothetical protein